MLYLFTAHTVCAEDQVKPDPKRPIEIRLTIGDRGDLEILTRLVSIDDVRGHEVWAVATAEQLDQLREAGFAWRVVDTHAATKALTMCPSGWQDDPNRSWSCYPRWDQYAAIMADFATKYPQLCRLVDLGPTTNEVRPHRMWAVVISDHPDVDEDEPEVLLTSSMHGDETTGYILTLRLIDYLLSGYASDAGITDLVDSTEIWINPLANPDGTYRGSDDSVSGAIRYYTTSSGGSSGVDPNRNFPVPGIGNDPRTCPSGCWLETRNMIALAEAKTFVLSANFHGGVEVVNYPWDTWQRRHPDDEWFENLSRDWADLAQVDSPGGYLTDFDNGITNGWDWYPVEDGRQDFMTFFHGGREVTIELSDTKLLPSEDLDDHWQWNRRAMLDFIGHAHQGIRGIVTDQHGRPLAAAIEVLGVDTEIDGSSIRTDPSVGDFHRLLLPGLYDLEVRATGCLPTTVFGIAVGDGEATRTDVSLWCDLVRRPSRRITPSRKYTDHHHKSRF